MNISSKKVTSNLENFSYNKIIANLYEMYSFLIKEIKKPYKKNTLTENYKKILTLMAPVIPHFSYECLSILNFNNIKWPEYNEKMIEESMVNIVIQINGKKRDIIKTNVKITEDELLNKITDNKNLDKYLKGKEIKRKIYIPNKLMNIII